MPTHVMLDIETWGLIPGSDIRSIGAVVFDPVTGWVADPKSKTPISQTFYRATENPTPPELLEVTSRHGAIDEWAAWDNRSECYRKYPLVRDPETVKWWNEQSPEAQSAFANPVDLREALRYFTAFLVDTLPEAPPKNATSLTEIRLWANDPHFDVSILAACYRACFGGNAWNGPAEPWHYRSPRSMKTATDMAGMTAEDFKPFETGVTHNALDDAVSQAKIVCEAYRRLGLQK